MHLLWKIITIITTVFLHYWGLRRAWGCFCITIMIVICCCFLHVDLLFFLRHSFHILSLFDLCHYFVVDIVSNWTTRGVCGSNNKEYCFIRSPTEWATYNYKSFHCIITNQQHKCFIYYHKKKIWQHYLSFNQEVVHNTL